MKKELVPVTKKRIPLALAQQDFDRIMKETDDAEEITAEIIATFREAEKNLTEAIDRRFIVKAMFEREIEMMKALKKQINDRQKKIEERYKRFVEVTKDIVAGAPEGVPLKGSLGRLRVQKSPPRVKFSFVTRASFSKENIVSEAEIEFFGLEPYVTQYTVYALDTERIKAALEAGEKLPWAKLEQGTHLRFEQ